MTGVNSQLQDCLRDYGLFVRGVTRLSDAVLRKRSLAQSLDRASESAYLAELRKRADDAGVSLVGVAVDDHGDLSALDETERRQAVDNHKKWFDACGVLGCGAFRANSGGEDDLRSDQRVEQCAKSFARLAAWGAEFGIKVMMENHYRQKNP